MAIGQHVKALAHRQDWQVDVGAQPERHVRNLRQGGHDDRKEHGHGPKGPRSKASGSGVHNAQPSPPSQVLNDFFRHTTKESLSLAA
jgi:hypothetical protein